jgi:hypothetical protein
MFTTSADILNIVLAVSIATLTVFLCIAIYYFIASAHLIYSIAKKVELGVTKVEATLDLVRNKLKNSTAYFMILGEVAKQAMKFVKDKQAAGKKK